MSSAEVAVLLRGGAVAVTDGPEPADGHDWWNIDDGAGKVCRFSSKVLSPA